MKVYGSAFLLVGLILTAQVSAADPVAPPSAMSEQSEVASSVTAQVPGQVYPMVQMEPLGAYRGYYGTGCSQGCCGADFGPLWASYCQDKRRCHRTRLNCAPCQSCAGTPCGRGCCTPESIEGNCLSLRHRRWSGVPLVRSVPGYYDVDCDERASSDLLETKSIDIGLPPSTAEPVEQDGSKAAHPTPTKADSGETKARNAKSAQAAADRSVRRVRYQMPLRPMCW